jgi:collagenase-like PrtC family protease
MLTKLRIAAPVTEPAAVEPLREAGADELYVGYMSEAWAKAFGDHDSVSRRQGAGNVLAEKDFADILRRAARLNMRCALTLNMRYGGEQREALQECLELFAANGGEAVILSDIPLMIKLREDFPNLKIYLSLMAVAASAAALRFYRQFNVSRVILPRFVSYRDMQTISQAFPEMEFEAIVFYNRCRYIDGFCRYVHFVGQPHGCQIAREEGCSDSGAAFACGACGLARLNEAGVNVLKVGGRGFPYETVVKAVRVLSGVREGREPRAAYRGAFERDCGENCYRSEDRSGGTVINAIHAGSCLRDGFLRDGKPLDSAAYNTSLSAHPPAFNIKRGVRYYIGGEACGKLLFDSNEWLNRAIEILNAGGQVTFVLPYLTVKREAAQLRFAKAVTELAREFPGIEVAINDYGSFEAFASVPGIDLSLGRLLVRQLCDITGAADGSNRKALAVPAFYLYNERVRRIEMDNANTGVCLPPELPGGLKISLHLDGVIATVAACGDNCGECVRECKVVADDRRIADLKLYRRDYTVCYDNRSVAVLPPSVDRLVYDCAGYPL